MTREELEKEIEKAKKELENSTNIDDELYSLYKIQCFSERLERLKKKDLEFEP